MVLRLEGAIKKTFVSGEPKYFQMMNLHDDMEQYCGIMMVASISSCTHPRLISSQDV